MFLSRDGIEINKIYHEQLQALVLSESDSSLRSSERLWRSTQHPDDAAAYMRNARRHGNEQEAGHHILGNGMSNFVKHHQEKSELGDKINDAYFTYNSDNPEHRGLRQQIQQWEKDFSDAHGKMVEAGKQVKALAHRAGVDPSDHFAHYLSTPKTIKDHKRNLDAAVAFHDKNHARGRQTIFHTHNHLGAMASDEDANGLIKTLEIYDPKVNVQRGRYGDSNDASNSVYWRHDSHFENALPQPPGAPGSWLRTHPARRDLDKAVTQQAQESR